MVPSGPSRRLRAWAQPRLLLERDFSPAASHRFAVCAVLVRLRVRRPGAWRIRHSWQIAHRAPPRGGLRQKRQLSRRRWPQASQAPQQLSQAPVERAPSRKRASQAFAPPRTSARRSSPRQASGAWPPGTRCPEQPLPELHADAQRGRPGAHPSRHALPDQPRTDHAWRAAPEAQRTTRTGRTGPLAGNGRPQLL
jgi:hypothetical protein